MKNSFAVVTVFLLLIIPTGSLNAALYIDDTCTTGKRHFSLEFSVDYYRNIEKELDPDTEEYDKTVSKEIALKSYLYFGLTDNWEVGVTIPYKFLDDTSSGKVNGFSDVIIDTKYRFWEEGEILPSFALYLDLKTDSGNDDKSLGTGKKNYSLNNIFTKSIGSNLFDLNLGYTFGGPDSKDIFFYALDWERILTNCVSICNEIYGETIFEGDFDQNIFCYGLSLSYQLNKMICWESGIGLGISKESPDLQLSSTITFTF
jgi:hypothetical protein